jgi:hypothetical protein
MIFLTNDEKIEKIQQELKQLSQKQVELLKSHQQQFFLYRWLQGPDPELQAVISEITRLEKDKDNYFKILQAAASIPPPVPEVDWTKSPLYWKRLANFGLITPAEQFNAYTSFAGGMVGLGYAASNFYRAHHLFKLTHCKEKTEEWTYHWARARATPQQIELASYWIERFKMRGYLGLGPPLLFVVYMWSKRTQ